jgi:alpha-tubulin suppressor-like RCC1 family protein
MVIARDRSGIRWLAMAALVASAGIGCRAILGYEEKTFAGGTQSSASSAGAAGSGGATSSSSAGGSGTTATGAGGSPTSTCSLTGGSGSAGLGDRRLFVGTGSTTPCATKADGSLYCWGNNNALQAGIGAGTASSLLVPSLATTVNGPVRSVASTGYSTCALLASHALVCFGDDGAYQLGNDKTTGPDSCADPAGCYGAPLQILPCGVEEVAGAGWWCGGSHYCVRTVEGKVLCWGDMGSCAGSLDLPHPTPVDALDHVTQLAAGAGHNCALRDNGQVWCWGDNGRGALGQGDTMPHPAPVLVQALPAPVTAIGCGIQHACAVASGNLYCWGRNDAGQVGSGATDGIDVPTPTLVADTPGLADVVQVVGSHQATCALTSAGRVFCWGQNSNGITGNGSTGGSACGGGCVPVPTATDITTAVEIAMGGEFALARLEDGHLVAWGSGTYATFGNGALGGSASTPVSVMSFP